MMWRIVLVTFLLPAGVQAASVALPLEGYHRVGKYMPLVLSSDGDTTLRGEGVLPLRAIGPARDAVFPLLVTAGATGEMTINGEPHRLALRPLGEDDRLVAVIGDGSAMARRLFPNHSVITLPLDSAASLRGPSIAWETLDALVVDGPLPAALDEAALGSLLGSGVTFAVRGDPAPDARWPWTREGEWWVLRHEPASFNASAAYAPVNGWTPGVPAHTRARAIGFGAIFSIAALGVLLLRPRLVPIALVVVSAAGVVGAAAWAGGRSEVRELSGEVILADRLLQRDRWVYQTAARASEELHSFDRTTRPVVVSPAHARELELMLECDAAGKPRQFSARLGPGRTVAYLTRSVTAERPGLVVTPGVESPLHGLARDAYAAPGVRVAGQTESLSPGEPPAVVLERVRR